MALLTLDTLKGYLGLAVTDTSDDVRLSLLLDAATAYAQEFTGRQLEKGSRIEYYAGTGQRTLALRQRPVWSITNLWLDHAGWYGVPSGSFSNTTRLLTQGVDYVLDQDLKTDASGPKSRAGLVVRIGTVWEELQRWRTPGHVSAENLPPWGNIKVEYVAGYDPSAVPADLQAAITMLVSLFSKTTQSGAPLEGERIGDYSYTVLTGRMMQHTHPVQGSVDKILARYREYPI